MFFFIMGFSFFRVLFPCFFSCAIHKKKKKKQWYESEAVTMKTHNPEI
tara:strand:+ start:289 stop:432 length:144 start_codon:yes stop_codon:yes gene_type:complete